MSANFVGGAMSGSQRDVVVRLIADTARFVDQMGLAGEVVEDMVRQVTGLDAALDKVRKTVGTTMLAMGAGIQAKLAIGTSAAAKWEQAFADVAKTVEGTPKQLERVDRSLRQMSTTIPIAAEGLAGIAAVAGQLGIEIDSIDKFTKVAAELGVATEMSSVQAIAGLSRIMKVMNEADETVEFLASSLVHLGNVSNSTESEILNFAQNIAGTANAMGFAAKEVLGIANAFASAGVDAEAGGTAVQKVMIGMNEAAVQGGRKLQVFTRLLGITNEEFRELWTNDPSEVLTRFVEVLQTQGAGAVRILQQLDLDDQRLVRAFLNVANSSESLRASLENSAEAYRDNTALSEEARKRFDTLSQSLTTLWNAIKQVSVSFGRPFLRALTEMVQALTGFINLFNKLPDWVKSTMAWFTAFVGTLATVTGAFILMSKTIGVVIAGYRTFRSALVQVPLQAFIQGLRGLSTQTEGLGVIARTAGEGFNFLGRIIRDVLAIMRDVVSSRFMQTDWGRRFASLRNSLASFGNWAAPGDPFSIIPIPEERDMMMKGRTMMGALVDGMRSATRNVVEFFQSLINRVTDLWKGAGPRSVRDISAGALAMTAQAPAAAAPDAGGLLAFQRGIEGVPQLKDEAVKAGNAIQGKLANSLEKTGEVAQRSMSRAGESIASFAARVRPAGDAVDNVTRSADDLADGTHGVGAASTRAGAAFSVLTAALVAGSFAWSKYKQHVKETNESLESTEDIARRVGKEVGFSFSDEAILSRPEELAQPRFEREQFLKDNEKAIKQLRTLEGLGSAAESTLSSILVRLQMEDPNMPLADGLEYIQDLAKAAFGEDYDFKVDVSQLDDLQVRLDLARQTLENLPGTREGQGILGRAAAVFTPGFVDIEGQQREAISGQAGSILELLRSGKAGQAEAMAQLIQAEMTLDPRQFRLLASEIEKLSEGQIDILTRAWERGALGPQGAEDLILGRMGGAEGENIAASIMEIPPEVRGDVQALLDLARERREAEAQVKVETEAQSAFYQLMGEEYHQLTGQEQKRFMQWRVFQGRQQMGAERVADVLREQLDALREANGEAAVTSDEYQAIASELEKIERDINKAVMKELEAEASALSAAKAVDFWRKKLAELGNQAVDSAADLELLEQAEQKLADAIQRQQTELIQAVETHKRLVKELQEVEERRLESIEDENKSYVEALEEAREAFQEQKEEIEEGLNTIFDAFQRFQGRMDSVSTRGVALNIEEQNRQLREFQSNLGRLRDMGLSEEFIEQSGLSDPQNWRQVARMMRDAVTDPQLIARVNQAWSERGEISRALMPKTEEMQKAEDSYDERISSIEENHREALERINENAREQTERINEQIAEIGKNTATSLAEAIEYASKFGTERMKEMAAAVQAEMKTTADKTTQDFDRMGSAIEGVGETGKTAATEIQQAFKNMVDEVKAYFMGEQGLVATVKGASDDLLKIGMEFSEQYSQTGMWAITAPGTYTQAQQPLAVIQGIKALSQYDGRIAKYLESQSPNTLSQLVTAAMQYGLSKSEIEAVLTPAGVPMPFAKGGITTKEMLGRIGEAGPEAIIPLDARGAQFFADAMSRAMPRQFTQQDSGMSRDIRMLVDSIRASGLNSQQTRFYVDRVVSQDPDEMARKLKQRERLSRLTSRTRGAVAQ